MSDTRNTKGFANKPNRQHSNKARRNKGRNNCPDKESRVDSTSKSLGDNDISWYAKNPQILKDAASISFFTPAGSFLTVDKSNQRSISIPGIYTLDYVPTIGRAMSWTDPANVMCRTVYDFVRSKNSGSKNYDATHIGFYLLAADSVLTMWAYLIRMYSCINYVNGVNRYTGAALLRAMNINPNDIRNNASDIRAYINTYAARASIMCIPGNLPYYARHMWMVTNIYKDSDDAKAQLYMYRPRCLYKYNVGTVESGAFLEAISLTPASSGKYLLWSEIRSIADSILESIINQEDFMIVSGDILKAYGAEAMFKFAPMPEDRVISPVYNSVVLQQIHNATITASPADVNLNQLNVTQNLLEDPSAGNIMYKPVLIPDVNWVTCSDGSMDAQVLDLYNSSTEPADVMEATRLVTFGDIFNSTGDIYQFIPEYFGSEIITRAMIWKTSESNGVETSVVPITASFSYNAGINEAFIKKMFAFDMAPTTFEYTLHVPVGVIGELDNYTTVDSHTMSRMHEAAILSMFNIPMDVNI